MCASAAADVNDLFVQTGTDSTWQQLLASNAIPIGTTSYAGVTGSLINVNNGLVEVGSNKDNPIISNLRIHTLGNPSVTRGSFSKWSRWYQEDGNTQVFRLFQGEYNVQNDRPNAARIEAFNPDVSWAAGDGWFQWRGTYTLIKPVGGSIFQAKNSDNDWAVMLNTDGNGAVTLNHRSGTDQLLATNMVGRPFDITVYDNGTNYIVYMDDQYAGYGSFSRPTGTSLFRWGMYVGDSVPGKDAMLFVTGAKILPNVTAPPKLSASLGQLPTRVIRGASVSGTLSVSNSIPVTSSTGAARLDYGYSSSGLFAGSGTGSDMALGGATAHILSMNTATTGLFTGTVSATATTPMAATPTFSQAVSMSVLDPAIGSFASGSTVTSIDIDFGTLTQGTGTASRSFSIFNRAGPLGDAWTAKLDLDGITSGAPSVFSTTLSPFANLASGSSRTFTLSMLTTTTGVFSGTYSLNLSDENVPGATGQSMALTVRGTVAPSPSSSSWATATGGSWVTGTNWSAGVPNSAASVATIGSAFTTSATITLDAPITLNVLSYAGATGTIAGGNGGSLTFSGSQATAVVSTALTVTAPMSGGFIKDGPGSLALTGSNTSPGTITVVSGLLDVTNAAFAAPGRTYSVTAGAALALSGTMTVAFGTSGTTTLAGDGTVRVNQGTTWTSPNANGQGDIVMALEAGARLEVNGVMGAGFTAGRGIVNWTNNRADLSLGPGARLNAQMAPAIFVDALIGSGSITKTSNGSTVLTIGVADGSGTFAGLLGNQVGSISLVKTGSGTQVLTAANSYTGATTVSGGTLRIDGDNSLATGAVAVAAGAALSGTGTVGGLTTIQSGATLAPGASPGTLSFTQGLTLSGGGNYDWQVVNAGGTAGTSSGWDLVGVAGSLFIGSTAADPFRVNLWSLAATGPDVNGDALNFDATTSGTWRIASAAGGITGFSADKFRIVTGATNGTGGFTNPLSGGTFSLSQSGNNLNLVFTPAVSIVINVASGTQTQTQAGHPLLSGTMPVQLTGAGTMVFDRSNPLTGPTTVSQGTLELATADTLSSSAVTVATGATLAVGPQVAAVVPALVNDGLVDVGLGRLTVTAGQTAGGIVAAIMAGRNGGMWSGASGITSSAAAALTDRAVGWLDNGDGSFTVGFAAAGDLNVNGIVDFDDVLLLVGAGLYDTGLPATWAQGDHDYNGVVDFDDVLASVSAGLFDTGLYNDPPSGLSTRDFNGVAVVPEPTSLGLCVAGVGLLGIEMRRRKRAT